MSPRPRRAIAPRAAAGFSLLEVILALAILVGAIAVLGELVALGTRSAASARDLTQAQLLCESKLSEVLAGITPPDPVQGVPFEPISEFHLMVGEDWLYSIDLEPVDLPGMMLLRVTVIQNLLTQQRPVEFSLVRLIQDPGLELPDETVTDTSSE